MAAGWIVAGVLYLIVALGILWETRPFDSWSEFFQLVVFSALWLPLVLIMVAIDARKRAQWRSRER